MLFYNVENFLEKSFSAVEKFTHFCHAKMYTVSDFENLA